MSEVWVVKARRCERCGLVELHGAASVGNLETCSGCDSTAFFDMGLVGMPQLSERELRGGQTVVVTPPMVRSYEH